MPQLLDKPTTCPSQLLQLHHGLMETLGQQLFQASDCHADVGSNVLGTSPVIPCGSSMSSEDRQSLAEGTKWYQGYVR